jgi:hypothetical protein
MRDERGESASLCTEALLQYQWGCFIQKGSLMGLADFLQGSLDQHISFTNHAQWEQYALFR